MEEFEKLGVFYLGRPYDLQAKQPKDGLLLYDSKDLVTHAVCIGMTGSGKTGLCLSLLEEALIDGIPALIIDPKGDLANLLLTFPELRAQDFAPWVNVDDARRAGLDVADYAAQQAELWKRGLTDWGESGARIRRLRNAADFRIYTPGSSAGLPVSILKSFAAPPAAVVDDADLLRERVGTTTTSLLGLLGIDADPLRSREHILIANILATVWKAGRDLDLQALIQQLQTPPLAKVGALDVDTFYPPADRFALAMRLNNLLAAPGFDTWLSGEALDVGHMLHAPDGKPRAAIVSIAHLNDAERMFFVSLLLNETLGWMRQQSGTTSLRAIVYMDEIFGYFPPVANPPSKQPLLTLLKQGRAFGVGVVLATQNPVDLDYKGLANTGTWFIGRLQTERDRARVLDGLLGAAADGYADRQQLETIIGGLGNRIFLLHNVHDDAPLVFETRWALSYLRGPLTRDQIKELMHAHVADVPTEPPLAGPARPTPAAERIEAARPVLPVDVPQYFLPARTTERIIYQPMLLGVATIRFVDAKAGIDTTREVARLTPITDHAIAVNWEASGEAAVDLDDLATAPPDDAGYAELSAAASKVKNYHAWSRDFVRWLYANQRVELRRSPVLKLISRAEESERDFRIRLQEAARQERDRRADQLRQRYAPKVAALEDRLRRAEQAVEREREQVTHQGLQTAISLGATLLGAFLGRKTVSASTIGRATTSARGVGRVLKEREDVGRATETAEAIRQQLTDLDAEFRADMAALDAGSDPLNEKLDALVVRPKRTNISVRVVALAWVPEP